VNVGNPLLLMRSLPSEQFLDGEPEIAGDFLQECGRDVSAYMEGDSRATAIRVPVLPLGTATSHLGETKPEQERCDLARPEDRDCIPAQGTRMVWTHPNSDSSFGSPSSRSISTTFWRFR